MVYWSPRLLIDQTLLGKERKIARNIGLGKRQENIYCIFLPQNPANLFEIMHVNEIQFPYYKHKKLYLLGLAESRENAIRLVCNLIAKAYQESEQPDIRSQYADFQKWCQYPNTVHI